MSKYVFKYFKYSNKNFHSKRIAMILQHVVNSKRLGNTVIKVEYL